MHAGAWLRRQGTCSGVWWCSAAVVLSGMNAAAAAATTALRFMSVVVSFAAVRCAAGSAEEDRWSNLQQGQRLRGKYQQ